jgi:hypothetical protein
MKQFYCFILGLFVLLNFSCITTTQRSSFAGYPEFPFFWDYSPGRINVTIDRIREESIASQLGIIVQTLLDGNQSYDIKRDRGLFLDISMEQRSFMHDVELYNTIFVTCVVRDEGGLIYARENEYIAGKRSLVAASEQNRIMKRILGRLLKDQEERYQAIVKQGNHSPFRKKNEP